MTKQTHISSCGSPWPALEYNTWKDTLKTVHQWTQIVGKIRLVSMPWQNHSWHTALYITARGLTTGSMPYGNGIYEIEFDFENHQLIISSTFEQNVVMALRPMTVADFYKELFDKLQGLGIDIKIHGRPNELEHNTPFAENVQDKSYNQQQVVNFWQLSVSVSNVFSRFRSDFVGKCSPVHFFWGAFDIALTRFSGRAAPLHHGQAPNMPKEVMQEAYSQEVSSCGFWPGADNFPQPMFYAYSYPSPANYGKQQVKPQEAFWSEDMGEFFLPYEAVRTAENPEKTLLDFLQSTYEAAANTGNWDREHLER
ncbi:DUF5996 family protein [Microscilla marina]|uniref:Ava_C0101 and related proteins n=1 Tax=Microscilla marina ATCC 23134 TaxID=313606 RepID=A1ZM00_MICM2|nr:DUF5996 family protein [Microscilla marina]EAY28532.1 conserved hypothetical protein [Microscilla marina ATCC 23134]